MQAEPVVVGEAPGPSGSATVYASRFGIQHMDRLNLLSEYPGSSGRGSTFPLATARPAAVRVELMFPDRPLIFLGTRVAAAFELARTRYTWFRWLEHRGREVVVVPHPSGVNHWWNEPEHCRQAATFFEGIRNGTGTKPNREGAGRPRRSVHDVRRGGRQADRPRRPTPPSR